MSWAEERRADRAATREQDRVDAEAALERRLREQEVRDQRARQAAADRKRDQAAKVRDRRARRAARNTRVQKWAGEHLVDLLIYPLAGASAAMAVPAMAAYGHHIYGDATGLALPLITELGMWCFALAVMVARTKAEKATQPAVVWSLQLGVWLFAGVGASLNAVHGWSRSPHGNLAAALVMAVVSIAGVVAHQLVVAKPRKTRKTRAERRESRLTERADRRVERVRRVAIRTAVAELRTDGTASLVHTPGLVVVGRSRLGRRRLVLAPTSEPTTDPVLLPDPWDTALADLVAESEPTSDPTTDSDQGERDSESGSVAVLDKPEKSSRRPRRGRRPIDPQARRNLTPDQALAQAREVARRAGRPVTATELRDELRCAASTARQLRDLVNAEIYGGEAA